MTKNQLLTFAIYTFVKIVIFILGSVAVKLALLGISISAILFFVVKLRQDKKELQAEIRERIEKRIWDIPVELRCRHCSSIENIDFGLETQGFKCKKCNGYNKLFINFTAIGETENSRSDG